MMRTIRTVEIGQKFGHWVVLAVHSKRKGFTYYLCRCDCGNTKPIRKDTLWSRDAASCGCFRRESASNRARTHGLSGNNPEYQAWAHMLRRCYTPTTKAYKDYGGRGISVCDRWHTSFENFLADMGKRPSSRHSIDRIDNDGNYEPSNCRWATPMEQSSNTRRNRLVTYQGRTMTISAWTRELGFSREVLRHRLTNGWPVELALTTPSTIRGLGRRVIYQARRSGMSHAEMLEIHKQVIANRETETTI